MQRLLLAFRKDGFGQVTMIGLADACNLTRRALYNHFSSKEDAFRGAIRWNHVREIRAGWQAGQAKLAEGGSALDVIVAILDARYGEAQRHLELSPHSSDLNVEAYRRCRDILEESAVVFQMGLAEVVVDLEKRDLVRLQPHQTAGAAAQLIADGARGVNLALPNQPANTLPERYRAMCAALIYGFAESSIVASAAAATPE